MKFIEKLDWGELATFVPNKKMPVYNWFYYKEGFARELVFHLIDRFQIKTDNIVLDPFCGSGTTLLACKEKALRAIGIDASELAVFASNAKVKDYNLEELREETRDLFRRRFFKTEYRNVIPIARKAFSKYALEDIAFFKEQIKDKKYRDFFLLALVNASMKVSYAWKDGGVIKIKKHPSPPLRFLYKRTVKRWVKDLEKLNLNNTNAAAFVGDARMMKLDSESVDAIITSPPYLNNIDYTKVYAIEEWIANLHEVPSVRSWIGYNKTDIVEAYFEDMRKALEEMHRVLRAKGKVAIVVGNAYVNGQIINSDELLAKIAEEIGFTVEEIDVVNKRYALEERTKKKGILRESIIIMEK